MAIWNDTTTKALVKHLKKAKNGEYQNRKEMYDAFRKEQPYKGTCKHCSAQVFLDFRIENKARKLINKANKNAKTKDMLVLPPTQWEQDFQERLEAYQAANQTENKKSKEDLFEEWILEDDEE